jgi:molybdopterin molybdotransferase
MTSPKPHGTSLSGTSHHGTSNQSLHERAHHKHQARSVAEHAAAVAELLQLLRSPHRTEQLPLREALGRGLVSGVTAPISLPPFANSQMDGWAVRSADLPDGGGELRVMPAVPAGASPDALKPGMAAPIMTGAMLPDGADAVVPIERAVPDRFLPHSEHALVTAAFSGARHLCTGNRQ